MWWARPMPAGHWAFDPAAVEERLSTLQAALAAESIALTLASGCDFHLSYDNIQDAVAHPTRYTINRKSYLLVELPDHGLSPNLGETFYELQLAGMTPMLTHPERNHTLQKDPARLADWMRSGLLIQITTSSVLGQMGKTAERVAHKLLADRWVHFMATDAHNLTTRPPRMREARDLVAKRYGDAYAQLLCNDNPLAAFEGRPWANSRNRTACMPSTKSGREFRGGRRCSISSRFRPYSRYTYSKFPEGVEVKRAAATADSLWE